MQAAAPTQCVDPCSSFQGGVFPGLYSDSRVHPLLESGGPCALLPHGTNYTAAAISLVTKLFSSFPATRGTAPLTRTLGRAT